MFISRVPMPLRSGVLRLAMAGLMVAAVAATGLIAGSDGAESRDRTVRTEGDNQFVPNAKVMSTLRFTPGHNVIGSGETLTLQHSDKTLDPHTLSVVDAAELPGDFDAVFACGVCDEVFQLFPPSEPPTFINGPGTGEGLDGRLDTLVVQPGGSESVEVTAEPGTTLRYLCAIHAWMQGTITVK